VKKAFVTGLVMLLEKSLQFIYVNLEECRGGYPFFTPKVLPLKSKTS
jgi:hypothetical protein